MLRKGIYLFKCGIRKRKIFVDDTITIKYFFILLSLFSLCAKIFLNIILKIIKSAFGTKKEKERPFAEICLFFFLRTTIGAENFSIQKSFL